MRFTKAALLAGLIIIICSYFALSYFGAQNATPEVEKTVASLRDIAQVRYDKITYSPFTQSVNLHHVTVSAALGGQELARIAKLSVKSAHTDHVLSHLEGKVEGLTLTSDSKPSPSNIHYYYQFSPPNQTAAFSLEGEGAWGSANGYVEIAHFQPSYDLLFEYPNLDITTANFAFHKQELVRVVLMALGQAPQGDIPDSLYISMLPGNTVKVAELVNGFPGSLSSNKAFSISSAAPPFSLMRTLESFGSKLKNEWF